MTERTEQFEHDPALEAIERELAEALAAPVPTDLADRVYRATVDGLPTGIEPHLSDALAAEPPADLSQRVYAATVDRLHATEAPAPVVAKIGPSRWTRWVAAAVIVLSVSGSIWMAKGLDTTNAQAHATSLLTQADWDTIDLALTGEPGELEAELDALSNELEELLVSLNEEPTGASDLWSDELYGDDLDALENRVRQF